MLQIALYLLSEALHVTYKLLNTLYFTNEEVKGRAALIIGILNFFC